MIYELAVRAVGYELSGWRLMIIWLSRFVEHRLGIPY